jgi:hypothetical protein
MEDDIIKERALKKFHYIEVEPTDSLGIKRNCPKCTYSGYHTRVFDQVWYRKCPVHDLELLERCAVCEQKWPSITALRDTPCPACGIKISIDTMGAFTENVEYHSLVVLNELIAPLYGQQACATISTRERDFKTGSLNDFYPTFRAVCTTSNDEFREQINIAGIPLFNYQTVSFKKIKVDQRTHFASPVIISLSVQKLRVLSKIRSEVKSALLIDHSLGSCIKDNKHSVEGSCYICKAWQLFKLSMRYTKTSDASDLNRLELYQYSVLSRTLKILNDTPYEKLIPQPFKSINIFSGSEYSKAQYEKLSIPNVASKELFEIQSWIFFVFILIRFEHIATNTKIKRPSTLIRLRESLGHKVGKEDELSLPYYIDTTDDDLVNVHIPASVLDLEQTMSKVALTAP